MWKNSLKNSKSGKIGAHHMIRRFSEVNTRFTQILAHHVELFKILGICIKYFQILAHHVFEMLKISGIRVCEFFQIVAHHVEILKIFIMSIS